MMEKIFGLRIEIVQQERSELLMDEFSGYSVNAAKKTIKHDVYYNLTINEMAEVTTLLKKINKRRIKEHQRQADANKR